MSDGLQDEHTALLTETIARHFDGARVEGAMVDLGFGDLAIECCVDSVRPIGDTTAASLFFRLSGGRLGPTPIFASVSGYADDARAAIVTGGCNWACAFGPLFQGALGGGDYGEAEHFERLVHGQPFTVAIDGLDRGMVISASDFVGDASALPVKAREHLGATPWLLDRILESGTLPPLPTDQASVVSVFCYEAADSRTLEVKVNGADWHGSAHVFDDVGSFASRGAALLRELAVLVPAGTAPRLGRDLVEQTLSTIASAEPPYAGSSWPGWQRHAGTLGEPSSESALARLEQAVGPLPEDYRQFVLSVQHEGAGPGYGLVSAFGPGQDKLGRGTFSWSDGDHPETALSGALVLAHAGCGVAWLLVLSGPHRGEVWVDAAGSDEVARRVAPSFDAWYRGWLDTILRNSDSFVQWDGWCCATPSVISQVVESLQAKGLSEDEACADLPDTFREGSVRIMSGGGDYFDAEDLLDPCEFCSQLITRHGVSLDVFRPGVPIKQGRASKRGLLSRLFKR